jgi:cytosolic 5'-nucleotidase 3
MLKKLSGSITSGVLNLSVSCDAPIESNLLTPALASPSVFIHRSKKNNSQTLFLTKHQEDVQRKISRMTEDGPAKLQIVSDFDFTLTKFLRKSYGRSFSCHKVLEECGFLSEDYHKQAKKLQLKYYPLEIDPSLDEGSRVKFMVEWVSQAHTLLEKTVLTDKILYDACEKALKLDNISLRSGVSSLFSTADTNGIPITIFSAGLANILEHVLKVELGGSLPSNVVVASNRILFENCGGRISGFTLPVFHVFNKRSSSLSPDLLKSMNQRPNILLLGDSMGDLNMSVGLNHSQLLKIGFLNDRQDRLAEYLENFDIVILGDPGVELVEGILDIVQAGGGIL